MRTLRPARPPRSIAVRATTLHDVPQPSRMPSDLPRQRLSRQIRSSDPETRPVGGPGCSGRRQRSPPTSGRPGGSRRRARVRSAYDREVLAQVESSVRDRPGQLSPFAARRLCSRPCRRSSRSRVVAPGVRSAGKTVQIVDEVGPTPIVDQDILKHDVLVDSPRS